jgi:pre-60S factor REI1
MASLPPISADMYAENMATSLVSSKQESLGATSSSEVMRPSLDEELAEVSDEFEDLVDEQAQINSCLFCTKGSDNLESNLEHMSSEHGLYLPEIEHISSLETVVRYLRTVITEYKECLYCGMIKRSAEGVRRHMLDKGHCMINLEREPELLEFWEFSDSEEDDTDDEGAKKSRARKIDTVSSMDLSQGKYTLPSGMVVASKSKVREARLLARRAALVGKETSGEMITKGPGDNSDKPPSTSPAEPFIRGTQGRAIAVRDAAGLVGISDQQMRSLITVQKKMQRQQAIVRASAAWADEKGGTHQKHYKIKMNLRAG